MRIRDLKIEFVPVSDLKPYERNARTHSKKRHCHVEVFYFEIDEILETRGQQFQWLSSLARRAKWPLLCQRDNAWLILVNGWLRLERAYLKLRLFLRV